MANALEQLVIDTLTKSRHEDILSVLTARFGDVPLPLQERIVRIADLADRKTLVTTAAIVGTLEEFAQALDDISG